MKYFEILVMKMIQLALNRLWIVLGVTESESKVDLIPLGKDFILIIENRSILDPMAYVCGMTLQGEQSN